MGWVLATIAAWILLAVVACLLIARAIRLADREALRVAPGPAAPHVVAHQIPQSTDGTTAVAAEHEAGPAPGRVEAARPSGTRAPLCPGNQEGRRGAAPRPQLRK